MTMITIIIKTKLGAAGGGMGGARSVCVRGNEIGKAAGD